MRAAVLPAKAPNRVRSLSLKADLVKFASCVFFLCLLFYRALLDLANLAKTNDLYSHVFLMPLVVLYLAWIKKSELTVIVRERSPGLAISFLGVGFMIWGWFQISLRTGWQPGIQDALFVEMVSFVVLVIGSGLACLGKDFIKAIAFPMTLLFFMAPLPKPLENGIEAFFQHTSADAAHALLSISGTPVFRQGLILQLPGIILEVGQECSGIRSSFVLFMSSLIAGYLFLQSPWKRLSLTLFVIPLGILRNGIRIFTLGLLCVHVNPEMINSWVHRKGGPLFFVLSLVPFFGFLLVLRRYESRDLGRGKTKA